MSAISDPFLTTESFPLPWSHYVRLMTVPNRNARQFYEEEAIYLTVLPSEEELRAAIERAKQSIFQLGSRQQKAPH